MRIRGIGRIVLGSYHPARLIGESAVILVSLPVLLWESVYCIFFGLVILAAMIRYWLRESERLGLCFLLCGLSAGYAFELYAAVYDRKTDRLPYLIALWVLLTAAWVAARVYRKRRIEQLERMTAGDFRSPAERDLPPAGRGICERCGVSDEIFFLPNGRRICPKCYQLDSSAQAGKNT